jgi:hypothetical protein
LLEQSRRLLYQSDNGILRKVEIAMPKLPASSVGDTRRLVAAVRGLLPECDKDGGPGFAKAMTLMGAFERNDYDSAKLNVTSFLEWKHALTDALDPLLDSLKVAA